MMTTPTHNHNQKSLSLWQFLRQWLEGLEIKEAQIARRIVKLIPARCPFERKIQIFGRIIVKIPALCKFNPLYEQLVGLRFRALCFLADSCGEDITPYVY